MFEQLQADLQKDFIASGFKGLRLVFWFYWAIDKFNNGELVFFLCLFDVIRANNVEKISLSICDKSS